METNDKTVLLLSINGIEAKASFNYTDVTLEDLFNAFRGLLIVQTFPENLINNYMIELVSDLKEKELEEYENSKS